MVGIDAVIVYLVELAGEWSELTLSSSIWGVAWRIVEIDADIVYLA